MTTYLWICRKPQEGRTLDCWTYIDIWRGNSCSGQWSCGSGTSAALQQPAAHLNNEKKKQNGFSGDVHFECFLWDLFLGVRKLPNNMVAVLPMLRLNPSYTSTSGAYSDVDDVG